MDVQVPNLLPLQSWAKKNRFRQTVAIPRISFDPRWDQPVAAPTGQELESQVITVWEIGYANSLQWDIEWPRIVRSPDRNYGNRIALIIHASDFAGAEGLSKGRKSFEQIG
jgi:hypothetical protein